MSQIRCSISLPSEKMSEKKTSFVTQIGMMICCQWTGKTSNDIVQKGRKDKGKKY